jgi:hypothetical protein
MYSACTVLERRGSGLVLYRHMALADHGGFESPQPDDQPLSAPRGFLARAAEHPVTLIGVF